MAAEGSCLIWRSSPAFFVGFFVGLSDFEGVPSAVRDGDGDDRPMRRWLFSETMAFLGKDKRKVP